jgi:hypothetical protein
LAFAFCQVRERAAGWNMRYRADVFQYVGCENRTALRYCGYRGQNALGRAVFYYVAVRAYA